jgi:hypothetical protein
MLLTKAALAIAQSQPAETAFTAVPSPTTSLGGRRRAHRGDTPGRGRPRPRSPLSARPCDATLARPTLPGPSRHSGRSSWHCSAPAGRRLEYSTRPRC